MTPRIVKDEKKFTRAELLVTSVLLLQFTTYLFGIFGNPIKGAFEVGQKVERLQTQFGEHCSTDSLWRHHITSRMDMYAAEHGRFDSEIDRLTRGN